MKRFINIVYAVIAVVVLAACNDDHQPVAGDDNLRPMTVSVVTDRTPKSRAESSEISSVSRYAISVWEDEICTAPAMVFDSGSNHATSTTGSFSMILDRTKSYFCLFWADNETGYTLDTELKNIVLNDDSQTAEAFCGKTTIPAGTSATCTATLKRAVAKITLKETNEMPAGNTMTVTFDRHTAFNVLTGTSGTPKPHTVTWTTTAKSGSESMPVQLNDEDIFALAPISDASLNNIIFQCNNEGEVMVSNVPLQANYNTSIKGHYTTVSDQTFTVNYNDGWNGDKTPVEF